MKTYTICGSMRFSKDMISIAYDLEAHKGFNVLQCVYSDESPSSPAEIERLTAAHLKKIDMSDGIYVVNIDGYIGESVRHEIEYALSNNKEVVYHIK